MTDMLIVGRTALNAHFPQHYIAPQDEDYIATSNAAEKKVLSMGCPYEWKGMTKLIAYPKFSRPMEFEIAWPGSTGWELLQRHEPYVDVASPEELLALKLSHRYLRNSPHFEKTRQDILLMRAEGVTVPDDLQAWLKRREKETLSYPAPKLNTNKAGFFTDNVPYRYVHDTLHLAVARNNGIPAYTLFQKDGAEVMVDKAKWDALPSWLQLDSVVEEAAVLALERHQIPNDFKPDPAVSFKIALQKVCTSISSGWWREFAWEHYDEALALRHDYVGAFRRGLESGIVKEVQ